MNKESAAPVPEQRWDFSILRTLRKQHQWSIADLAERAEVAASAGAVCPCRACCATSSNTCNNTV